VKEEEEEVKEEEVRRGRHRSLSRVFTRRPLAPSCRCSKKAFVCARRHWRRMKAVEPVSCSRLVTKCRLISQRNLTLR
jgi:hypothetical protein